MEGWKDGSEGGSEGKGLGREFVTRVNVGREKNSGGKGKDHIKTTSIQRGEGQT